MIDITQNMNHEILDIIERLNIQLMICRSGQGLMSYSYSFIQIGGYKGQSFDDITKRDIWDGDYRKVDIVLDCRKGKCEKISIDRLKSIIEDELKK